MHALSEGNGERVVKGGSRVVCMGKFVCKRKIGDLARSTVLAARALRCLTSSLSSSPIGLSRPAPPGKPLLAAVCFFSGLHMNACQSLYSHAKARWAIC